jgi:transposase InsO family protein
MLAPRTKGVFKNKLSAREICSFLGKAIRTNGKAPRHVISDKEAMFTSGLYKKWCKSRKIRPRYGAVGKHGSIAVVERFIRTMKNECTRKTKIPLRWKAMRQELAFYIAWYNEPNLASSLARAGRALAHVHLPRRRSKVRQA